MAHPAVPRAPPATCREHTGCHVHEQSVLQQPHSILLLVHAVANGRTLNAWHYMHVNLQNVCSKLLSRPISAA